MEQIVVFIPKSFKIAKLRYLTMQNIFSIYALLFLSNFDFCAPTLKGLPSCFKEQIFDFLNRLLLPRRGGGELTDSPLSLPKKFFFSNLMNAKIFFANFESALLQYIIYSLRFD